MTNSTATIKCCLCGLDISGGKSMCMTCLAKETDCTARLSKQEQLTQCRECFKWKATNRWLRCEPESPELLALCLKRIKNLGQAKGARLIDASFVWTESHSKRVIVKMIVESMEAVSRRDVIRQTCECEFIVTTQMCPECQSDTVDQTWRALVQIRQNVSHRRTMFFLEQEILKRKLAEKASNVDESPFGLDVYFNKQEHAVKFAEVCQTLVPIGNRTESKKLTGQDSQNNQYKFRHTICLEIVPICKHDLCILSKPLRSSLLGGSKNGLILVEHIARNLHIRDVETGKISELSANKFFAHPFRALITSFDLIEFVVLDIEEGQQDYELNGATIEVARMKDFGENDQRFFAQTWSKFAKNRLESGDIVLGYDLTGIQEDDNIEDSSTIPNVILLKKKQEDKKKIDRRRRNKNKQNKNKKGDVTLDKEDTLEKEEEEDLKTEFEEVAE